MWRGSGRESAVAARGEMVVRRSSGRAAGEIDFGRIEAEAEVGDISVRVAIADAPAETPRKIVLQLKRVLLEILAEECAC